jgi:hypothetical protein
VEGGAGLSLAVSPSSAARLDASWLYQLGASGSVRLSAGLVIRPWTHEAALPTPPPRRAWLDILGVQVQPIYPALYRFYANHPVGTVSIRNAGKSVVSDLRVSFRIQNLMEQPLECSAKKSLSPGESWDAPVIAVLSPSASSASAGVAEGELAVAFVQDGEPWTERRALPLEIKGSNLIPMEDPRAVAAFVLPADSSVRELAAGITDAIPSTGTTPVSKPVGTAIAVREALGLLAIRVDDGSWSSPDGLEGRLKYPGQTLNGLSGDSIDVAVLEASLLEACGVKSALAIVAGKAYVALDLDATPALAASIEPLRDSLIVRQGQAWVAFDAQDTEGDFAGAIQRAHAVLVRNTSVEPFFTVHEAWSTYPEASLPPGGSAVHLPDVRGLRAAVSAAIATFTGATAASADAGQAVRRLLLVFETSPAEDYSEYDRTMLSDSLVLALRRIDRTVVVIPYGGSAFPQSDDKRIAAAKSAGADCILVVQLSGGKPPSTLSAFAYDVFSSTAPIKPSPLTVPQGLPQDVSNADWGSVADLVTTTFGTGRPR